MHFPEDISPYNHTDSNLGILLFSSKGGIPTAYFSGIQMGITGSMDVY